MKKQGKKVIVAMSGGVDSSVAAKLLKDQGYEVLGIFLHFWKDDNVKGLSEVENKCCSVEALMDARKVCQKIGISLYTMNFSRDFKKEVVDNFLDEYKRGNTPNPCVKCNKFVKLGLLIEKAKELGFDYVASGHYIRLRRKFSIFNFQFSIKLLKGVDKEKDQSYFLYTLNQEQLKHLLFPLGDYTKDEVRKMAKKFNLQVAEKSESQEICFIPEKSHNEFLKRYIKLESGDIKTLDGEKVGEHQSLPLYTIGQRKGVEIGGIGPFYVVKCDYKTNTLYVVKDGNDPALFSKELVAKDVNWVSGKEPELPFKCEAVIRYRHKPVSCKVACLPARQGSQNSEYLVNFNEAQRAVTPGQSVMFYQEDEVIGGGIIQLSIKN